MDIHMDMHRPIGMTAVAFQAAGRKRANIAADGRDAVGECQAVSSFVSACVLRSSSNAANGKAGLKKWPCARSHP